MRKQIWLESTHLYRTKTGKWTGINYYTASLAEALVASGQFSYSVVANLFFTTKTYPVLRSKHVGYKFWRFFPGKLWNRLVRYRMLPRLDLLFGGKPDLIVFLNFARLPISRRARTITFVHDLAFVRYPEFIDDNNLRFLRKQVPLAINSSTRIATISESTKKDIISHYGISEDRVDVIPGAVDSKKFRHQPVTPSIKTKYGLPEKYVLSLSTMEPRKNLETLIRAYLKLPQDIKNVYALVLAGGKGWKDDALRAMLGKYGAKSNIYAIGYVDDADLAQVYSGATIFVFPSLYEGFGLPVLEAMACGVPVLSADNSSLPEAGGKAAEYFNATDIGELNLKIAKILGDEAIRRKMRDLGLQQSRKYTWARSARLMNDSIRKGLGL